METNDIFAARAHQAFPTLTTAEIKRLLRFGDIVEHRDGALMFRAGESRFGMHIVLEGKIAVSRNDGLGNSAPVTVHGPGQFSGEVSQVAGRPTLVNGHAVGDVKVLTISPASLRVLLIAEAELGERIVRAMILRRVGLIESKSGGPVLVASPGHPRLHLLQGWLTSNSHPHTVLDPAIDEQARALCERYAPTLEDWPLVVCPDGSVMKNPSVVDLGRCLGTLPNLSADVLWDVIVVGAGPAGLATAVYAASEGLSVLILETRAYGGQAGASSRIENYLGFPTGISGQSLAGRAYVQSQKFGAEMAIPAPVGRLICEANPLRVEMCGSLTQLQARAVVLACGARYRRPALANLKQFEGKGVYYWASPIEANLCTAEEIVLVGGGNSAGQAAVYLASHAAKVHVLIRRSSLAATMSNYLIDRINSCTNIELHTYSEIVALGGNDDDGLTHIQIYNKLTATESRRNVARVFLFIGAEPNTGWLGDCGVEVDDRGFIRTGLDVTGAAPQTKRDGLETSVPGVFAIGDVRANSTKRVAAAVGEGAAVAGQIYAFLERKTASLRACGPDKNSHVAE